MFFCYATKDKEDGQTRTHKSVGNRKKERKKEKGEFVHIGIWMELFLERKKKRKEIQLKMEKSAENEMERADTLVSQKLHLK
ncbi:hypothetical protein OUZ56_028859 [Daphnia magna]|uniref:Uncharacterized protein n=1 Tax=Daphnia magna TaxID=35525 RepID=A0ABR0B549_9CRUS|nr:hypothetical protein OUZ56_028859 [Daphnia magna]